MKLFYTILILFTILILNVNGQVKPLPLYPVEPSQNATALAIIFDLFGVDASSVVEICNYTSPQGIIAHQSRHFQCEKMNNVDEYYTIVSLSLNSQNGIVNFNLDISAFVNLTQISFNSQFLIMGNWFYNNIDKFQQLQSIYFYNVTGSLSETVQLPQSLTDVTFGLLETKIGSNWFNSSIERFHTGRSAPGFQLPTTLNTVNNKLSYMSVIVTQYFNFPTNADQYLLALDEIQFQVYNDITEPDYQNYTFPTIGKLPKLATLSFYFVNNKVDSSKNQLWEFPKEYLQLPSLSTIALSDGTGFTLDSGLDFSGLQQPFYLSVIGGCNILNGKTSNSFKFPKGSGFYSEGCDYNLNIIDLTNIIQLTVKGNDFEQNLPQNIYGILYLSITESAFTGSIPESYCSAYFTLSYNELTGQVPSCIKCIGGAVSTNIFPNQFDEFTPTSPPVCNEFSIDQNYNHLISTDASGNLIVTGTQLGWTIDMAPEFSNMYGQFIVPNSKFQIFIGQGEGVGHSVSIYLHKNKTNPITFEYSYVPPVITGYSFSKLEGSNTMYFTLNGTGFSFVNFNTLTFNGVEYQVTSASEGGGLVFTTNEIFENLVSGDTFNVSMDVAGQKSPTVNFVYFPGSIEFDSTSTKHQFNSTGGNASFSGSFATTNINYVSASVNGLPCVILSVSQTQLNLNYPTSDKLGEFTLTVSIGGRITSTQIEYIQGPSPTPSVTNLPTNNTSSENNDDDGSYASTLSIPLFTILILIINLLI